MSRYLASLTEKAQNALDRTGIGAHLPISHTQQVQQSLPGNDQTGYISDDVPDGRSSRHPAIQNITHTLRSLHTQYTQGGPPEIKQLQTQIINSKGVALDLDAVARDTKAASKDFYLWGQEQEEDIRDVSDRLAYLNFATGTIIAQLSDRINASRVPLKNLKATEEAIGPRRAQRKQLQAQIQAARAAGRSNVRELEEQLAKQTRDDEPLERDAIIERRKALLESERIRFEAIREVGEKLSIIGQASEDILAQLPLVPPSPAAPYKGKQATAKARTAVQTALDTWKPGMVKLSTPTPPAPAIQTDTRSFGETHASELSRVNSFSSSAQGATVGHPTASHQGDLSHLHAPGSSQPVTPTPKSFAPPPGPPPGRQAPPPPSTSHVASSPPLDPTKLNNAPAPIPPAPHSVTSMGSGTPGSVTATTGHAPPISVPVQSLLHSAGSPPLSTAASTGHASTAAHKLPAETPIGHPASATSSSLSEMLPPANAPGLVIPAPTVAETGVPISAGNEGPGPLSGSLLTRDDTVKSTASAAPAYNPIDDVPDAGGFAGGFRQEWPAAGSARAGGSSGSGAPVTTTYESAEDEKRRIAREERERVLRGAGGYEEEQAPAYSGGGEGYGDDKKAKEKEKEKRYPDDRKDPRGPGGDGPPPSGTPPPYGF